MKDGHQENDKRGGTENVAGIVGIGKAIELSDKNQKSISKKLITLRNYCLSEIIEKNNDVKINGDLKERLPGNINLSFYGINGDELVNELDKREICISSGSACSSGYMNPSYVLSAIGLNNSLAKGSIRITFGKDNDLDDVRYLVNNLNEIIPKIRK